jgi:hypothetical protein
VARAHLRDHAHPPDRATPPCRVPRPARAPRLARVPAGPRERAEVLFAFFFLVGLRLSGIVADGIRMFRQGERELSAKFRRAATRVQDWTAPRTGSLIDSADVRPNPQISRLGVL